jgi:peptidyl-prolyl cis-trans isomerase A (cyclophilin A)
MAWHPNPNLELKPVLKPAFLLALMAAPALLSSLPAQADNPRVWLDFEQGPVILELDRANAPVTTENFLAYVNNGFYNGIMVHRIVPEFVIQAGGFDQDFIERGPLLPTIPSEADNGLSNEPGTIAMALRGSPDSAQSQFYINTALNDFLDDDFTVFGRVVVGMALIDQFESRRTGTRFVNGLNLGNVPMSPPLIRRAAEISGTGFPIMPQHAGSWFDAANPGIGFNVEIARDAASDEGARVVLYWYDYRAGEPYWLLGVGEYRYGATAVNLDLISWDGVSGPVDFLQPPPGESYQVVGTLNLHFEDCLAGEIDFDIDELGSGSMPISRLSLPEGVHCEGF